MSADLRERLARAIARAGWGDAEAWRDWQRHADAALSELAPELVAYVGDAGEVHDTDFAPQPQPQAEVLVRAYFHRFSEVEDDYTIYHTLDGVCEHCIPVLIVRDTKAAAPQPQPQASAEDVALVGDSIASLGASRGELAVKAAWQRIRADYERMGAVK